MLISTQATGQQADYSVCSLALFKLNHAACPCNFDCILPGICLSLKIWHLFKHDKSRADHQYCIELEQFRSL